MFDYIPEFFKSETADTDEEADRWYDDKKNNRRPPELLPRDEVARAINSEIKAGRGSPHGGIFLDIASRRDAEYIRKRLPSMYHQFKELADVDITAEPMEIGPTCHYVMGGVEVDARHRAERCHRPLRRGGVLRRDARLQPARRQLALGPAGLRPSGRRGRSVVRRRAGRAPDGRRGGGEGRRGRRAQPVRPVDDLGVGDAETDESANTENPYTIQQDLQQTMNDLVGIIRTADELSASLEEIEKLKERAAAPARRGAPAVQPRLAPRLDLRNMLLVSECIAKAALERQESRGGHTRDDFPGPNEEWGAKNLVLRLERRRHRGRPDRTSRCR